MAIKKLQVVWLGIVLVVSFGNCQATISISNCGQNVGCLRFPTNCGSENCTALVKWKPGNGSYLNIELMAVSVEWVALGLSRDTLMGGDSVVECIVNNSNVNVQFSYNTKDPNINDVYIKNSSSQFLSTVSSNYADGLLSCQFLRRIEGDNNAIYSLNNYWYLFLGFGPAISGVKQQHKIDPQVSPFRVNLVTDFLDVTNLQTPPSTPSPVFPSPSPFPCTQPTNCIADGRGSRVTFLPNQNKSQVKITMASKVISGSGWLSLAFSTDTQMADDSVIDCILIQNGTIIVQHSYNQKYVNSVVNGSNEGIEIVSTSNADGILQCVLNRQINNLTNPQIFNLTRPYYLFLAHGPVTDQGIKKIHYERYTTQDAISVASDFSVLLEKSYFSDGMGTMVSFYPVYDGTSIEFEIKGPTGNSSSWWIGLGFSYDAEMGNDSVLDCILFKNGSMRVQNSFNIKDGQDNEDLHSVEGISVINTTFTNGVLSCVFRRNISGFMDNKTFPLDKSYYLLLAEGEVDDSGKKLQHKTDPTNSANEVDVRLSGNVTIEPGETPPVCDVRFNLDGYLVVSRSSGDGSTVTVQISGPTAQNGWWIAVGFSKDRYMGDDSVLDCILKKDGNFIVQNSYNEGNGNIVVNNSGEGITEVTTAYINKRMTCNFKRKITGGQDSRIFSLKQDYYLFLAYGPVNDDGTKTKHQKTATSGNMFNLATGCGNATNDGRRHSNAPDPIRLLRAHGVLMITAFVMLMSGAIILARYYRTCWPEDLICGQAVWFWTHRFLMLIGLFCCIAGFILVFCYGDGYIFRNFNGSDTYYPSYYWVHGPLGIVVMILFLLNPIIAIFRCDPDGDRRWIFNWLHWIVGTSCQITAGITLFFGIKMGEQKYQMNHTSVFWILIGFVGFHVFVELVLMVEKFVTQRQTKKSFTINYGMGAPGEELSAVKEGDEATRESLIFRYFFLVFYTFITMGLWLAMIVLVGGSFEV